MLFMNSWEIENAQARFAGHEVLGPAVQTLANLADWADHNSDGWCYWPKPCRAAKRLQELIQAAENQWRDAHEVTATPAQLRAALAPVKAFRTRQSAAFEVVEPSA